MAATRGDKQASKSREAHARYSKKFEKRVGVTFTPANNGYELYEWIQSHGGATYIKDLVSFEMALSTGESVPAKDEYTDGWHDGVSADGEKYQYLVEDRMVTGLAVCDGMVDAQCYLGDSFRRVSLPLWAPGLIKSVSDGTWQIRA